jgi:hypothetical protein
VTGIGPYPHPAVAEVHVSNPLWWPPRLDPARPLRCDIDQQRRPVADRIGSEFQRDPNGS